MTAPPRSRFCLLLVKPSHYDIDVNKRERPVDLLEFFYLTPLPGSEDHQKLFKAGVALDADLNRYDGSEAAKALVERQRRLKDIRDRAIGALLVAGG